MRFCCDDCFEYLGKKSTKSARFWLDLCLMSVLRKTQILSMYNDFEELKNLENEGFISTTEEPPYVNVRINNYDESLNLFCSNKHLEETNDRS